MTTDTSGFLYYNGGCVCHRNQVILASKFREDQGTLFSRVSMLRNLSDDGSADWYYANLDDTAVGAAFIPDSKLSLFLGENGQVLVNGGGDRFVETIPDREEEDKLTSIRVIAGTPFVCGMAGNVFRRDASGWQHCDLGIRDLPDLDLESLDGISENDIYAVGWKGAMCHFDGKRWSLLDSPTNRPLNAVRAKSADHVVAVGNDGLVFAGNKDGWIDISDPEFKENLWAVEYYQDRLYTAHAAGIRMFHDDEWEDVNFGFDHPIGCYRLHANDGVLWSIGIDDLAQFDGKSWITVPCPLNSESDD